MPKKGPPPPRRPRPGILRQRGFQQCSRSRRIRRASLLARPTMFGLCELSTISSTAQQGTNLRRNRITYLCRGPQKRHRTTKTRVVAAGNVAAPWSPRRRWEGRRRREARGTEGSRPVRTGKLPAFAGGRLWSEAVGDDSVAKRPGARVGVGVAGRRLDLDGKSPGGRANLSFSGGSRRRMAPVDSRGGRAEAAHGRRSRERPTAEGREIAWPTERGRAKYRKVSRCRWTSPCGGERQPRGQIVWGQWEGEQQSLLLNPLVRTQGR